MSLNNFRAAGGSILTKLPQTTWPEVGVITRVQLLEGPQKFGRAKKRPNFGAIFDNFRLRSQISTELIDMSNIWKKTSSTTTPSTLGERKLVNLVHKQKKVLVAHSAQPKWTFFWRLHFGHYAVLPSQIFTLVTDWPRLPSPSPNGDGRGRGAPKILIVKI